jgi:hypothetical protein
MTLKTDIDQIAVDAGLLHDIVHGGPTAVVATDGGTVKSVAKAIADLEVQIVTEAGSYVDQCQDEVALATAQAQTATNQAAAAAGSALSAASVVAQDLSAIDRTVFASTTLVDAFLYDTSKDSDGGAWRKRCSHTSWENETLSGNWLGSAANEAAARAISGAVTGSYYYDTTAAVFYKLNAGSGVTQVYRGNVRQFPAQVLITVEAARVVMWDLTQAGCPMWMVFVSTAYGHIYTPMVSVAMLNGSLVAGMGTATGFSLIKFISDSATYRAVGTHAFYRKNIAGRNAAETGFGVSIDAQYIVANVINDVAMTVLPNAPVDVATGLPIPTIAVATNGGVSVIKDDGNVWDIVPNGGAAYSYAVAFTADNRLMFENDGAETRRTVRVNAIPTADVTHVYTTKNTSLEGYTNNDTFIGDLTYKGGSAAPLVMSRRAIGTNLGLNVLKRNPAAPSSGMIAYVTKDYNSGWMPGAIKGAWLSDSVAETLTGAEKVTNGDFATDTSANWVDVQFSTGFAVTGNQLQWTASSSGTVAMRSNNLVLTGLTVGKTYTIYADLKRVSGSSTGPSDLRVYSQAFALLGISPTITLSTSFQRVALTFTAADTWEYVYAYVTNGVSADVYAIDNISCRLADADRSVKAKGLQAFGSLTKAAVASGAQLMGYSGFSAANYLEQPYNSDLDFGTGDFCIMGWLNIAASAATQNVYSRAAYNGSFSGSYCTLYCAPTGSILAYLSDDAGVTYDVITSPALYIDGKYHLVAMVVRSGVLELWVDGIKVIQTAVVLAALGQTNTSAATWVGVSPALASPFLGGLALLRATATAPSAEQIKHIYETEKGLFAANAQCCLAGTSNAVTALAYDDETDLLHVGTSYGRSAFKGLVRVASEATPVGAITALAAGAGVIAQAGASGADVYVPAYSLREELLRDAEQMARFGQNLIAHDFTATASQTNFALPAGWEIVAVYQQGALKRETTSWTRSFDGFIWSVVLGTGATVSDWISILAKRV